MNAFLSFVERNITAFVAGGIVFGGTGLILAPHTVLLKYYRQDNALHIHEGSEEKALSSDLQDLTQTVLDKILLDPMHEAAVDFFVVNHIDPYNRGSACLRTGAIVGLPVLFDFKTLEDITKEKMWFGKKWFSDWGSEDGQKLSQSLLLSENAKKFAIAREIQYTNALHPCIKLFIFLGGCFSMLYAAKLSSSFFHFKRTPAIIRRLCYTAGGLSLLLLTKFTFDIYENRRHKRADNMAAMLDKEYAQGGVEYYTKVLHRNQMCRKIVGDQAEKMYTPYGNIVFPWYDMTIPLTERRGNIIKCLEQYIQAEQKEREASQKRREQDKQG